MAGKIEKGTSVWNKKTGKMAQFGRKNVLPVMPLLGIQEELIWRET